MKSRKEKKSRIHNLPNEPVFVNCFRNATKSFDILMGDQQLEIHIASYGPEIDQLQHVKSVSHIIIH